jgi:hypothetical protein
VPVSCTAKVYDSSGALLDSGACTVDAVSTTLSSVTNREALVVGSTTGIVPGRPYWIVSQDSNDVRALVWVDSLTATALDVHPAPARLPVAGDAFRGARVTYTIAAQSALDARMRIEWTVTDIDGKVGTYRQPVAVVRTVFSYALRPEDVRAYLAARYAHVVVEWDQDPTRYEQTASRATDLVRRRIRGTERFEALAGDPDAFREPARLALKIALLDEGVREGVDEVVSYTDSLVKRLDDEVKRAIASCWYDHDDDGTVSGSEARSTWIRLRR